MINKHPTWNFTWPHDSEMQDIGIMILKRNFPLGIVFASESGCKSFDIQRSWLGGGNGSWIPPKFIRSAPFVLV